MRARSKHLYVRFVRERVEMSRWRICWTHWTQARGSSQNVLSLVSERLMLGAKYRPRRVDGYLYNATNLTPNMARNHLQAHISVTS